MKMYNVLVKIRVNGKWKDYTAIETAEQIYFGETKTFGGVRLVKVNDAETGKEVSVNWYKGDMYIVDADQKIVEIVEAVA